MISRKTLAIITVVVLLPALAFGARLRLFELRTGNGFLFDVMVESSMGMSNGLIDAYDGCYMLRVSKAEFRATSFTVLFGGRGVQSPRHDVTSDIQVSRQVYVPRAGDWARYYDLIINDSKRPQTIDVELYGNLGSDSSTKLVGTSDNDMVIEPSDHWLATDDHSDGSGDPSLAHVYRRAQGKLLPVAVTLERDNISVQYKIKLPPRGQAALVFFAVQTKTGAEATNLARELTKFGPAAKAHLSAPDIRLIRN
jgi:hypothetical protein